MSKVAGLLALILVGAMVGCGGLTGKSSDPVPDPPPKKNPPGSLNKVNHIIYMLQENRSFDQYFGQLNAYRTSQGLSPDVDVTPANASQMSFEHTTTSNPF